MALDLWDSETLERIANGLEWIARILDPEEKYRYPSKTKQELAFEQLDEAQRELDELAKRDKDI